MIYRQFFNWPNQGLRRTFDDLERLRQRIDRAFAEAGQRPAPAPGAGVFPLVNVTENKECYFVRAELPGISSEDLDIQVTAKNLTISGERKIAGEQEGATYHRREREAGKFSRILSLPADIDTEKVDAKLTDGILTVTVPKAEKAKPRQISVT
jgi:HSP20 family protein